MKVKVTQSCPTLCNTMDYTVRGILQARILEWVSIPFSRGSSQLRDRTQVSHTAGGFFTGWATREAHGTKPKVYSFLSFKVVCGIFLPDSTSIIYIFFVVFRSFIDPLNP